MHDKDLISLAAEWLDETWYLAKYPDVAAKGVDPKAHYKKSGYLENRSINPVFDGQYYIQQNEDVAESGMPAIIHYLKSGAAEGRSSSPLISHELYMKHYGDSVLLTPSESIIEDFADSYDRLKAFFFFDEEYYRTQRRNFEGTPNQLLMDFFTVGWSNGLAPHRLLNPETTGVTGEAFSDLSLFLHLFSPDSQYFHILTHPVTDPAFSLSRHGDQGCHPIIHYLKNWQSAEMFIHPLFDPGYYARKSPSYDGNCEPLSHFLKWGEVEGVDPNAYFDIALYRSRFGHLLAADEHPLTHYMRHGRDAWCEPSDRFGQKFYLERYAEGMESGDPALVHYLHTGLQNGWSALPQKPFFDDTIGLTELTLVTRLKNAARNRGKIEEPRVTVIIPAYENIRYTLRCVLSCLESTDSAPFDLIIADDCSPDGSGKTLQKYLRGLPNISVQINDENLGFLKSCNAAAARAKGTYVMFLNNDTVVLNGWLDSLLDVFDHHEGAGLVGSKLVYPNGLLQEAGGIIWEGGSCANFGRMSDPHAPPYNYLRDVDYISGAAILIHKALWKAVGGFSEELAPAYYEDTDLAMKVRNAGRRVIYQPLSTVVHYEGISSGTDEERGIKKYQKINKEIFAKKWAEDLSTHGVHGDFSTEIVDRRPHARILVFDAAIPRPDKDSGSITAFYYLKVLSDLGYRVTFVPRNLEWAGQYSRDLQALGVHVVNVPYENDPFAFALEAGKETDLFILSRVTTGGEFFSELRAAFPEKPIIFDTVDLHHLRLHRQFELSGDHDIRGKAEALKYTELSIIRNADATIIVSEYENKYLTQEIGPFPGVVIPLIYQPYDRATGFDERKDIAFIGGYNHPPNVDAVEHLVRDIWPLFRKHSTGAKLHIIGSHMPPSFHQFAAEDIQIVGFVDDLETYLDRIKFTIAPLRYGAGVKGKVGNSLRMGVPVVGTPVATEGMGLQPNEHVLTAKDPTAFAAEMASLYDDEELWEKLSVQGQNFVNESFGLENARKTLGGLCRALLSRS